MPRLTDTQLVILSAAAQREDRAALPLPEALMIKGAAVTKTLKGLRKRGLLEEKPAPRGAEAWREGQDGRGMMLAVTAAGLEAIGVDAEEERAPQPRVANGRPKKRQSGRTHSAGGRRPKPEKPSANVRAGTKQALLIDLLKRKRGASIEEIVEATGWQAHSVRGAISGALKKKLGLTVSSEKVDRRGRIYRIAGRG